MRVIRLRGLTLLEEPDALAMEPPLFCLVGLGHAVGHDGEGDFVVRGCLGGSSGRSKRSSSRQDGGSVPRALDSLELGKGSLDLGGVVLGSRLRRSTLRALDLKNAVSPRLGMRQLLRRWGYRSMGLGSLLSASPCSVRLDSRDLKSQSLSIVVREFARMHLRSPSLEGGGVG